MTKLSICVPVYNRPELTINTIRNILDQKIDSSLDTEVVICDDMSNDGTWEAINAKHTEWNDPRLKLYRNERNLGIPGNWNRVFDLSQGDYVTIMGADNMLMPDYANTMYNSFEPGVGAVAANYTYSVNDQIAQRTERGRLTPQGVYKDKTFLRELLWKNPFLVDFTMFKRSTLESLREDNNVFMNYGMAFDYDLWIRYGLGGMSLKYLKEPLGVFKWHGGNASNDYAVHTKQSADALLSHARELRHAAPWDARKQFLNMAWVFVKHGLGQNYVKRFILETVV